MKKNFALALFAMLSFALNAGELPATTPDPVALVKSMRAFCGGLNTLACEIDFLRTSESATKVSERRAHFESAFQRPNLLSILLKDEGQVNYAWISDGKDVSTYLAGLEKYSKGSAPGTFSELFEGAELRVVKGSLEGAFLLDELIVAAPEGKLPAQADAVEYVGLEEIGVEKAHHVRLKRAPSNWDVWIADGPAPLPVKIYSDISNAVEPRQPGTKTDFTVTFKRWLPGAALDPRAFQFDPSSKAKRVSGFLPEIAPHPLLNQRAPAATLQLADGSSTTLAAHLGRDVVVLDFWAISCVPCIGLLPKVDAVARKFGGKNVVFYAMNEGDSAEDVREFFKRQGIALTATLNNKTANFAGFKVEAIPQTFVIDKSGVIRAAHSVHSADLAAELTALIETLLK